MWLRLIVSIFLLARPAVTAQGQPCTLCEHGDEIPNRNKSIQDVDQFNSCGAIDDLLLPLPLVGCADAITQLTSLIDFRQYCNCPNYISPATSVCQPLCGDGQMLINEDVVQDALGGYTCGEFNDLVAANRNPANCDMLTGYEFESTLCCAATTTTTTTTTQGERKMVSIAQNEVSPSAAPSVSAAPTFTAAPTKQKCSLCPDKNAPQDPMKIAPLIYDTSCQILYQGAPQFLVYPNCSILPGFDAGAYCNCTNTQPPDLCPFCSPNAVTNPTAEVYFAFANTTVTCAVAALQVPYIDDMAICMDEIVAMEQICCASLPPTRSPKPATAMPTLPPRIPTPQPRTSAGKAARSLANVIGTTTAIVMWLGCS